MAILNYLGITLAFALCLFMTKVWLAFAYQVEWTEVIDRVAFGDVPWVPRFWAVFGYIFCTLIMTIALSFFIDVPIQKFFGSTTPMVFGGRMGSHDIWYEAPGNSAEKSMTLLSDMKDSHSFNSIYEQHDFRGIEPRPGDYGFRASPTRTVTNPILFWLSKLALYIFCIGLAIGCLHIFAWEAQGLHAATIDRIDSPGLAFEDILSQLHLNKGSYGLALLFAPILMMVLHYTSTTAAQDVQHPKIIVNVKAGQKISGKIIDYEIIKVKRRRSITEPKGPSNEHYVDEGDRDIFIEFTDIYPAPVYVAYRYNALENPDQDSEFKELKRARLNKAFLINDNLTLSPTD